MAALHRFPRAEGWTRGYDRRQVDRFVHSVERSLLGGSPTITADEIRKVGFNLVRRGYDVEAVDERLDELELRVLQSELRLDGSEREADERETLDLLRRHSEGRRGRRFPRAAGLRTGYAPDQVDEFVARVVAELTGATQDGDGSGIGVDDVRSVIFRPKLGGYDEDAVDDFLDLVVDVMLRRTV